MFHKCAQLLWSQDPHASDTNGHVFNSKLGQLSVFGVTQNMTGENLHLESRSGFMFLLCQPPAQSSPLHLCEPPFLQS